MAKGAAPKKNKYKTIKETQKRKTLTPEQSKKYWDGEDKKRADWKKRKTQGGKYIFKEEEFKKMWEKEHPNIPYNPKDAIVKKP